LRVYLDSCVVIYLLEGPDVLSASVERALTEDPHAQFLVSDLVRLECRTGPLKHADKDTLGVYDAFFERVAVLHFAPEIFDIATALRTEHGLRTPDALHVAAASAHHCDELWTGDRRLAAVAAPIRFRVFS